MDSLGGKKNDYYVNNSIHCMDICQALLDPGLTLFHLALIKSHEVHTLSFFFLRMWALRQREVDRVVQSHMACKKQTSFEISVCQTLKL